MIRSLLPVLTFVAALGAGLTAGLLFAFSAFVMDALARLPAEQGIAAMQSINVAVLNPLFGTVFFGTAVLCIVLAVAAFFRWGEAGAIYLVGGSLLYFVGTIVVTIAFNVPLNNALAAVAPNSAEGPGLWTRYIVSWTAWNHVRTVAALMAWHRLSSRSDSHANRCRRASGNEAVLDWISAMLAAWQEILVPGCENTDVVGWIEEYRAFWRRKLDSLKRHLEEVP